ncbi:CRAL/TRIO domain-containing protein [Mycena indigotica]|uniref:CRAL/TRIO domain-containing protein n=1 Tax=Mycena indigotica TaxID=2126181 RepID=A0A8H6WDP8_9AGAR|nr:CRAL/TRIO domain-containing protein [Mycena indigotica]KAF7312721.1 CRAL/TRIO domain-containing protein [Mycena indigotica]
MPREQPKITTTRRIITTPPSNVVVGPIYRYTMEQEAQIAALSAYTSTIALPHTHSYHLWEQRFLSRLDTHPRYMRAAKWQLEDAKKRIRATMEWRREYQPDLITPDEVRVESETGKLILNGFDNEGRPILYVRPGRENTETSPRQVRYLVWCLERAKDLMPLGQESVAIIVDYKSTTLRTNPSIAVARKVLNILQRHYAETLGRAIVVNLPPLLNFFFKGISPFLDPVTREKMRFNPPLLSLIPASQLDADFGGDNHFEFEKDEYWRQLLDACHIAPDGTRVLSPRSSMSTMSLQDVKLQEVDLPPSLVVSEITVS